MIGRIVSEMKNVRSLEQEHIAQVYHADYVRKTDEEFGYELFIYLQSRT